MNKKQNKRLIPELRFPEFKNSGEWVVKTLEEVTDSIFDGTHQTPTYVKEGIPFFSVENIVSGNKNKYISKKDYKIATSKNKPEKGDILITRIGKIGFSAIVDWDYDFSIYVTLACIKKSKFFNSYYLHSYFQSEIYQKEIFSKSLLSAVPCKINMNELRETKALLPSLPEQQKIASFLSNLDELIAAHKQKLQLLKQHKKGLMQNLFPQEGKKLPEWRFPEFQNSGEWVEKNIGSIAKVTAGGTPKSTEPKYWNGNISWMNSGELNLKRVYSVANSITELGLKESSTKKIPPLCVLIGLAGQGKTRGTAAINYIELCTNQSIAAIHPNKDNFCSEFLYQKIDSMYNILRRLSTGQGGRGGLNLSIIREIKIYFPSLKEQQKIADFLSNLDELITAQAEKIEQLEGHKKGLMQRMFPASIS